MCLFVCLFLIFFPGEAARAEGKYKGIGDKWDWDARCEIHKGAIKSFFFFLNVYLVKNEKERI